MCNMINIIKAAMLYMKVVENKSYEFSSQGKILFLFSFLSI